jgi:hypothetical protein
VAGPFPHRGKASDWVIRRGQEIELEAQERAGHARSEMMSGPKFINAIRVAMGDGTPPAPRGRPVSDYSRETMLAFEYYWRIRQPGTGKHKRRPSAGRVIAAIAKEYHCTPGHVRKVRKEYAPLGRKVIIKRGANSAGRKVVWDWDDDLLTQLRAQALANHKRPISRPKSTPKLPLLKQAELWLQQLLSRGPVQFGTVKQRARVAGLTFRTVERAKSALGVTSQRIGSTWAWKLTSRAPRT